MRNAFTRTTVDGVVRLEIDLPDEPANELTGAVRGALESLLDTIAPPPAFVRSCLLRANVTVSSRAERAVEVLQGSRLRQGERFAPAKRLAPMPECPSSFY